MLTQWFCITLNSMSPVLPPIWDRFAPKGTVSAAGEPQQYQPICPCPQATVPILNCLIINDHADKRREMPFQWALVSTSNSDKPAGARMFQSSRLSFSLYPSVCCLLPQQPTSPPHQPPAHTLCGRHESSTVLAVAVIITRANNMGSSSVLPAALFFSTVISYH